MSGSNGSGKLPVPITFVRDEPVTYAIVVARRSSVEPVLGTNAQKALIEPATEHDLFAAGYVPREWWERAFRLLPLPRRREAGDGIPEDLIPPIEPGNELDVNEHGYVST